jgi:ribosomal protein S18 acetylase RimI-like enzyme
VTGYYIQAFNKSVDTAAFRCGQAAFDDYILRFVTQDIRRNVARVFAATPASEPNRLAGFFTLSAGSVNCADLPPLLAKKLPRYPVPVALIGRLAVDVQFQRAGLGGILLADACQKVVQASNTLAVAGIVVDVKDTAAAHFYQSFGFLPLPGHANRMLLPAKAFEPV